MAGAFSEWKLMENRFGEEVGKVPVQMIKLNINCVCGCGCARVRACMHTCAYRGDQN